MPFITRHAEKTIRKLSESFPALLVTGARQTGKTSARPHCADSVQYLV
mgnify:CR=1 FL=1